LTVVATRTLLITMSGRDRPGVTAAVFEALSRFPVDVLDLDQMVLRGRLVLGVLVSSPRDPKGLAKAMEATAADLAMECEIESGEGDGVRRHNGRAVVTVLGGPL
jgi:phosphoserine phosphatase